MSAATKILLSLILLVGALAQEPAPAFACSCAMPPTAHEALDLSTAVFAGTVLDVGVRSGLIKRAADPLTVTFQVDTVWKGPTSTPLHVTTSRSGGSCGYTFAIGQDYLVYAQGKESDLSVSLCSRTQPLSTAGDDLGALGEGSVPFGSGSAAPFTQAIATPWVGLALGAALLVALLLWRRSARLPLKPQR